MRAPSGSAGRGSGPCRLVSLGTTSACRPAAPRTCRPPAARRRCTTLSRRPSSRPRPALDLHQHPIVVQRALGLAGRQEDVLALAGRRVHEAEAVRGGRGGSPPVDGALGRVGTRPSASLCGARLRVGRRVAAQPLERSACPLDMALADHAREHALDAVLTCGRDSSERSLQPRAGLASRALADRRSGDGTACRPCRSARSRGRAGRA